MVAFGFVSLAASGVLAQTYEADLGPSPYNDATKPLMTGRGSAQVTLSGNTLTLQGTFEGLSSPVTGATLRSGIAIGVPGPTLFNVTIDKATGGALSGTYTLSRAQVQALQAGRIYVQVDSQKVGEPYGIVWGWLLPQHKKLVPEVSQEGPWYLPQLHNPGK
jgi:hypothetical protein